ncbi:hypothetical protein B4U80_10153 [Leptotrombidium deliense]|uniref:Uncharacterized protein n=1 Tax=Leptotrombidium deliense TaxID=299467 RepID=A0A443RY38_9ACAR|nr:hypothetical protein B4U80_10153 [Leptotrombidium deliense]
MQQKTIRFNFKNYSLASPEASNLDVEIYPGSTTAVEAYYTSLALFEYLMNNIHYATGTARIYRIRGIPFMKSK